MWIFDEILKEKGEEFVYSKDYVVYLREFVVVDGLILKEVEELVKKVVVDRVVRGVYEKLVFV